MVDRRPVDTGEMNHGIFIGQRTTQALKVFSRKGGREGEGRMDVACDHVYMHIWRVIKKILDKLDFFIYF